MPRVLDQIYGQKGNFDREYIFVDDGSTDNSIEIVEKHTASWNNVTIIRQNNHGVPHATNRGMFAARMEFIKLCDADDLLVDQATQTLLNALLNVPDAVLAYGNRRLYKGESDIDCSKDISEATVTRVTKIQATKSLLRSSKVGGTPAQFIFRTSALHACGGCDERVKFVQDLSLLLRLSLHGHFLQLESAVCYSPHHVPGQLSENRFRELGDGMLIRAYFIADHPNIQGHLKRYACRRVGRRCWVLARRYSSQPVRLRYLLLFFRSFFPIFRHQAEFMLSCTEVFRES